MSVSIPRPEIDYPDSDGQPMAENTLQFEWIVTIKEGLDTAFRDEPNVFVAGDLLWYPVEGDPTTRIAPDAMVAIGRPKGHRGSYRQWVEGGIAPQVVVEVLSPGNRAGEMLYKLHFYDRFGVEEYYVYDPDRNTLEIYERQDDRLLRVRTEGPWTSPRLGVRFVLEPDTLLLFGPDGRRFQTYGELALERDAAEQRAEDAQQRAEDAQQRAEDAQQRAEDAEQRAARLAARLRELGVDPDA
jgi:Uma2 family endonuclease